MKILKLEELIENEKDKNIEIESQKNDI